MGEHGERGGSATVTSSVVFPSAPLTQANAPIAWCKWNGEELNIHMASGKPSWWTGGLFWITQLGVVTLSGMCCDCWACPVQDQENSVILVAPFQCRIFHNCVNAVSPSRHLTQVRT